MSIPNEFDDDDELDENTVSTKFEAIPIYAPIWEAAAIELTSLGTVAPMHFE